MSVTYVHARICEPSPWIVRSRSAIAASMNARIAPPPIWPGPKMLKGCTVTVGSFSSSW